MVYSKRSRSQDLPADRLWSILELRQRKMHGGGVRFETSESKTNSDRLHAMRQTDDLRWFFHSTTKRL
jgi:hypothetical protein